MSFPRRRESRGKSRRTQCRRLLDSCLRGNDTEESRLAVMGRRPVRTVDVAEVAARIDAVAHHLLDLLGVGETAVALALPDQLAIEMDLEDAAGAGDERHLT